MKRGLLVFFSISWFLGFSQKTLSGVVIHGGDSVKISAANVILKDARTNKTLGFTSTNEKGSFVLSLPNNLDSVFLKVSNVGYSPFEQIISTSKGEITIPLFYSAVELREVIIKKSPILEVNDTLVYDVNSFKSQEDQVIGDLIARLPGIQVEPDGRIKFQGKDINKYYIEGLDLLEGRYSIANRNIKIDDIKTIEVYQNHQPVRILDSLEFSDQAALNLVLKKNRTVVHTGEMGAGLEPLLGNVKTSNILFKPTFQLIATLQANNIGVDLSSFSTDFTNLETFENQPPKLNILSPNTPSFDSRRWLVNEDVMGTFNSLNKLKNGFQVKTFASYGRNKSKLTGVSETAFFNTSEEIARLQENRFSSVSSNQLKLEFIAERNNEKDYSKNKLTFFNETNSSVGLIGAPLNDLDQQLNAPKYSVRNTFDKYIKLKKSLLTFQADVSYLSDSQNLLLTEDSTQTFRRNILNQDLNSDIFLSKVQIGSKIRLKKFNIRYLIGNNVNLQRAASSLLTDEDINLNTNHVSLNQVNTYVQGQAERKIFGYQLTLGCRLNTTHLTAKPAEKDRINSQTYFFLEPHLSVSKRFGHFWTSDLSFQRTRKFGSAIEYFNQELLLNYREVQNGLEEFQTKFIHSASLTINYKDVVKNVFGGYTATVSAIRQNLISETSIANDGQTAVGLKAFENRSSNIRQDVRLSKFWRDAKINLSINAAYISSSQEIFVNTVKNTFFTYTFIPSLTVAYQPLKTFKWVMEGQLQRNKITSEISGLHRNNQATLTAKLLYFPSENVSLQLQNDNYVTQFGNLNPVYNNFINADIWFDFKGKISQVKLSFNNILNEREFNIIDNQNLFTSITNFTMRPFQVLGTVKFTL